MIKKHLYLQCRKTPPLSWKVLLIILLSNSTAEPTDVPIDMPVNTVLAAVDEDRTWILFKTAPKPLLPIKLLFILPGAVALLT